MAAAAAHTLAFEPAGLHPLGMPEPEMPTARPLDASALTAEGQVADSGV